MNAGDTEVAVTTIAWTIITPIAESGGGGEIMVLTKCVTIQLMKLNSMGEGWTLALGTSNFNVWLGRWTVPAFKS